MVPIIVIIVEMVSNDRSQPSDLPSSGPAPAERSSVVPHGPRTHCPEPPSILPASVGALGSARPFWVWPCVLGAAGTA